MKIKKKILLILIQVDKGRWGQQMWIKKILSVNIINFGRRG